MTVPPLPYPLLAALVAACTATPVPVAAPAPRPAPLPAPKSAAASASAPAVPGPLEAALAAVDGDAIAEHVRVLASDAYAGRFPGTAGETRTLAYLTAALARFGVEPALDDGYLQEVPLTKSAPDPATALRVAFTGAGATGGAGAGVAHPLSVPDEALLWPEPARPRVDLDALEVVWAGYGIVAPEEAWDDYAGLDVEGKVVLAMWGDPGMVHGDPARFDGRATSPHAARQEKADHARARGARALLLVHPEQGAPVPFSLLVSHLRKPSLSLRGADDAQAAAFVHGTLPEAGVAGLCAASGVDWAALRAGAAADGARGRALPWRLTASVVRTVRPVLSHNVVGVLRGRTRPDECILYTAHWDHVGVGDGGDEEAPGSVGAGAGAGAGPGGDASGGETPDRIHNGAVDNATGTAALLELARVFGELPERPERSIVFVATTSEEQGLLGATHYAAHPVFPLADTVAVINMDALFPFGASKGMTVVAMGSTEIEPFLAAGAEAVGRRLYPDPQPEAGAFFRSDHYPFAAKGVPAVFAVGGPAQDPDVGETLGPEPFLDYMQRYHQPSDEYDADTWDMAGIVQDVRTFVHAGWSLAMSDAFPNWVEGSPYRPLRDAMRAGEGGR